MVATRIIQDGFSAGEFEPHMHEAINNPRYNKSAKKIENFIPEIQGPASFRKGFRHHVNTRQGSEAFLIDFTYNEDDAYVLELTSLVMRVHKFNSEGNPSLIASSQAVVTDITSAAEGVVTANAHGFSNQDSVYFQSTLGLTELNGPVFTVSDVTANTFKLKDEISGDYIDTSAGAYVANGTSNRVSKVLEIATPYPGYSDLTKVKHAQFGNVMWMVHPDYKPQVVTRVSETNWSYGNYTPTADPFTAASDYPRAIAIHDNRLWFGGTINDPQNFWATVAGDFGDMTIGVGATDAFEFRIGSSENDTILWLRANERYLVAGTLNSAKKIYGEVEESAVTPTAITVRDLTATNSSDIDPSFFEGRLLFIQRSRQKLRALEFNEASAGYEAVDMNIVTKHLGKGYSFQEMENKESDNDIIWIIRSDGTLIGVTVNFREGVFGWHTHTTDGYFTSISKLKSTVGGELLWVVAKRNLKGRDVYSIEVEAPEVVYPQMADFYTGQGNKESDEKNFLDLLFEAQKISVHLDTCKIYDGLYPREVATGSALTNFPITLSALTGTGITVTSTGNAFEAGDVGREIWGADGRGRGEIKTFVSATEVTIDITSNFKSLTYALRGWYLTTDEVWGLQHLEGEVVDILADGSYIGTDTVGVGGRLNIGYQASYIQVGLKYKGILIGHTLDTLLENGHTKSNKKNINRIGIKFHNTLTPCYGNNMYNLTERSWRPASADLNRVAPLFTGTLDLKIEGAHAREQSVIITQEKPYPCTVSLMVPLVEIGS